MMAEGVIALFAEEHVRRPRASAKAIARVIAGCAVAPEVARRPLACEAQRAGPLPDVLERVVPDVPAHVVGGGQRRAPFDVPVRLDSEDVAARPARTHVTLRVRRPDGALVGAEVADVVARPEP